MVRSLLLLGLFLFLISLIPFPIIQTQTECVEDDCNQETSFQLGPNLLTVTINTLQHTPLKALSSQD